MGSILTNYGEEYFIKNGLDSGASTWSVGLYNDSTDSIVDAHDVADISTEPGNANYSRQTDTFSPADNDSDATGLLDASQNDSQLSFDFSDQSTSENVDSWFLTISYQATGDGSSTTHLIATGSLSQTRDIGSIDTLNINAGGVGVAVN